MTLTFCSMAIAGGMPSMDSTSGLLILPRNWRAYEDRLSAKRLCPSANKVSKANDDFPEPEMPVTTTSLFLGISTVMSLRLLTFAPLMIIFPSSVIVQRLANRKFTNISRLALNNVAIFKKDSEQKAYFPRKVDSHPFIGYLCPSKSIRS